eukprot:4395389-Amphidinium_carterae.1
MLPKRLCSLWRLYSPLTLQSQTCTEVCVSTDCCPMPYGQRSAKLSGWVRSLDSKRSGRERVNSTPSHRTPAKMSCNGRTVRQTVLNSHQGWSRGLRQSFRPAYCDFWNR